MTKRTTANPGSLRIRCLAALSGSAVAGTLSIACSDALGEGSDSLSEEVTTAAAPDYSDDCPEVGAPVEDIRESYSWYPECTDGGSGYDGGGGSGYDSGNQQGSKTSVATAACATADPRKLKRWNKYDLNVRVGLFRSASITGTTPFEVLHNICGVRPWEGAGVPGCGGQTGGGGCTKFNLDKIFSTPRLAMVPTRDDVVRPPYWFAGGVEGVLEDTGDKVSEYPSFYPTAIEGKETINARVEMIVQALSRPQAAFFAVAAPDVRQFLNQYFSFVIRHELRHVKVAVRFAGLFLKLDNVEAIEEDGQILELTKTKVTPGAPPGRWNSPKLAGAAAKAKWDVDYKKLFNALRATEALVHTVEEPHWITKRINFDDHTFVDCPIITDPMVERQIESDLDIDDVTLPEIETLTRPWF